MSYILDALKRADADRERGHVPGLHSQGSVPAPAAPVTSRRGLLIAAALGLAILAAAAVAFLSRNTPPKDAPSPEQANEPPPVVTPAPEPSPALAATPTAVAASASFGPPPPILAPEPPAQPTASSRAADVTHASIDNADGSSDNTESTVSGDPDIPTPAPASPPPVLAPPPPAPAPKPAVRASAALTAGTGLPPGITVSGASYSENPEHRMLIVNGKVVHEGQDIQPGLRVEAIGAHSAVLKHDGTFYNIRY